MKKIMKMMAMALVAVAMTVGFAACSSSDDDNNGGGGSQSITGKLNMNFTFSEDLLAVADIKVTYIDSDGKTEKTEDITTTTFNKEITYNSLPVTTSYTLQATLKSSYTVDKEKYDISIKDGSIVSSTSGARVQGTIFTSTTGVKKEGLERLLSTTTWKNLTFKATISKDGSVK